MAKDFRIERNKKICAAVSALIASGKTLESASVTVASKVWNNTVLSPAAIRAIWRYSPGMTFDRSAKKIQGVHKRLQFLEQKIAELKSDVGLIEELLKVKLESH